MPDLTDAIEKLRRAKDSDAFTDASALAARLVCEAALSGDLIPLAHHNAMMAATVEKAAERAANGVFLFTEGEDEDNKLGDRVRDHVRALTDADATTALAEAISRAREEGCGKTKAASDVLAERARQVSAESWTPEHDDTHDSGQLARAATCYAYEAGWPSAVDLIWGNNRTKHLWPWSKDWWKPKSRRENAVRAAALLVAEIERLDRAALAPVEGAKA